MVSTKVLLEMVMEGQKKIVIDVLPKRHQAIKIHNSVVFKIFYQLLYYKFYITIRHAKQNSISAIVHIQEMSTQL